MAVPDPARLGGLAWAQRTGGALAPVERRRLLAAVVRGQGALVAGVARRLTGRLPAGARELQYADVMPPDSRLAAQAEQAAAEQPVDVRGHAYRTWAFGRALAVLDHLDVDDELFYVAALLHDHGLHQAVPGQDFTLRAAARAAEVVAAVDREPAVGEQIGDAIAVHPTPGITAERDGAMGVLVQAGAALDLIGLRCGDVPRQYLRDVHRDHPRGSTTRTLADLIRAEAQANPRGRFALTRRCGFTVVMRVNPIVRDA